MANRKVIFDIEANDKTKQTFKDSTGQLDKYKQGFEKLTGVSLASAGAIAAAGFATQQLVKFTKESIEQTVAYNAAIIDQARLIGIDTETMSRLVQVADDVFISQEQLKTALTAATRQGIDVSIEGLKKLSIEYLSLDPKVERGEFLLKKFGRSGADMGKLMELGADGIESATKAISDNMIVTEESSRRAIEYKQAVDELNDSWQGVKYSVGNTVIPYLTALGTLLSELMSKTITSEQAWRNYFAGTIWESKHSKMLRQEAIDLQTWNYWMGQGEIQIISMNTNGYKIWIDEMGIAHRELVTLTDGLNVQATAAQTTTTYFKELTQEMIFNAAAAGLDSEQALYLAQQMGLVDQNTLSALSQIGAMNERFKNTGDIKGYAAEVKALSDLLNGLHDINISVMVSTVMAGMDDVVGAGTSTGVVTGQTLSNGTQVGGIAPPGWVQTGTVSWSDNTPVYAPPKASGGPVFGNHPYVVGEAGPELFVPNSNGNIVPNNQLGGNVYNFNVSGAQSPQEFLKECARLVKQQGGLPQS